MKSLIVFVLIVSFSLFCSVTFEKTFGKEWNDHANAIIQTEDGGYLYIGCEVDSLNYKYSYFTFNKLDKLGVSEWKKSVTGNIDAGDDTNEGHSVIQTNDGGYVFAGNLRIYTAHVFPTEVFVVKTDKQGNVIWDNLIIDGSHGFRYGYEIIQTEDGGFLIIGESMLILTEYGETILYKLDSEGKFEWGRSYSSLGGGELVAHGKSIIQTKSNEFTFLGISWDDKSNILQTLVRTDSIGDEIWKKTYSGLDSISVGYSLKQTSDYGFVIFGMSDQEIYGNLARLIKTDENGESVWDKYYGNFENTDENTVGRSLNITTDGGYILAGYTENILTGLADAWLIKTDSEGNEIWKKTFGREGDDRIYSVQQTSEGGYILAGYTDSKGSGGKDMWIIKTDETGTEIENPFIPQTTELFQNYPNPFNPATEISFDLQKEGYVNLTIYNSKGEFVRTLSEGLKGRGMHTINFDASGLDSGIYFYKLTTENHTITRKMLFLK